MHPSQKLIMVLFVQMVPSPTHCGHLIDKIFVSCPFVYKCTIYRSILKTKHCGVL